MRRDRNRFCAHRRQSPRPSASAKGVSSGVGTYQPTRLRLLPEPHRHPYQGPLPTHHRLHGKGDGRQSAQIPQQQGIPSIQQAQHRLRVGRGMAGSGQDRADVPRGGRTRLYASARHRGAERRGRPRLGVDCGAVSAHQEGCQQGVLHSRQ